MKHAKRFHTIADFAEAYRAGSTDPVKVASRILADIKDSDSKGLPIRALIQIKEVPADYSYCNRNPVD
jgi:hypothetical protein